VGAAVDLDALEAAGHALAALEASRRGRRRLRFTVREDEAWRRRDWPAIEAVSMCQIASDKRRARSIWATLAPRCLPMRALVCW
jgi:hypothetical protein